MVIFGHEAHAPPVFHRQIPYSAFPIMDALSVMGTVLQHLPVISFAEPLLPHAGVIQVAFLQKLSACFCIALSAKCFVEAASCGDGLPPVIIIQRESIEFTPQARAAISTKASFFASLGSLRTRNFARPDELSS